AVSMKNFMSLAQPVPCRSNQSHPRSSRVAAACFRRLNPASVGEIRMRGRFRRRGYPWASTSALRGLSSFRSATLTEPESARQREAHSLDAKFSDAAAPMPLALAAGS
ncbi:MAG: hypothetical protein AAFZ06_09995, partial [Pseudomonadota bacterium]